MIESCARSLGADTRPINADAINNAKTNFFIQYSWDIAEMEIIIKHAMVEIQPFIMEVESQGDG